MWSNKQCGVPDHSRGLATIARISLTSWRRVMWPRLGRFFYREDGWLYQKRLLIEAAKVEEFCLAQHKRKSGDYPRLSPDPMKSKAYQEFAPETFPPSTPEKFPGEILPNPLKSLNPDATGDEPGIHPSQESNIADAVACNLDLIPRFEESLEIAELLERCKAILGPEICAKSSFGILAQRLMMWRQAGTADFDIVAAMIGWRRRERRSIPSSPSYFWPIIQEMTRRRTNKAEDQNGTRKARKSAKKNRADQVAAFLSAAEEFES
jgi:hypothetical protein